MANLPNPRLSQMAGRWMNPEVPEERTSKVKVPVSTSKPDFKKAFFLADDDFGKEIHNLVTTKYSDIEAIKKISFGKGSNPFYVVAVNEVLREKFPQIRTATQADLEKILKDGLLPLKGQYEDSGLVWRSNQDPNKYFAEDISGQFKKQGITLQDGTPYVLWLHNLSLRKDKKSAHKLSFVLPDNFKDYFPASILNKESGQNFDSANVDVATGIPKTLGSGSRTLYTRDSGVSRLCLDWGLGLSSDDEGLGISNDVGRVALVSSDAGASQGRT